MTKKLTWFIFLITCCLWAQQRDSIQQFSHFTTAEFLIGKTQPANQGFPETKLQKALVLNFGNYHNQNTDEWAYRLKYPRTGVSFAINDYGNKEYVGYSASVLPFMEFDFLRKKHKDLKMHIGVGATYFTRKYDSILFVFNDIQENTNRAISTKITWAFRMFLYYDIIKKKKSNWRVGLGYFHHSNGHTKLPNQGLNSFLFSLSRQSNYNFKKNKLIIDTVPKPVYKKSSQNFYTIRFGAGQNVFSEVYNDKKEVYTLALSYGKIINKTFKIGIGFYYRFYQHYYDYIKSEGEVVVEQYPYFQDNPFGYASNIGFFISSELLLGHIGFELEIGYNIYKPFYKVEWKLNQGLYWEFDTPDGPEVRYVLGELDGAYKAKLAISARLGLKYYLISNQKSPKSNFFIAVHIKTNLGQADFTELSLGYVHRFTFKENEGVKE